MNLGGYHEIRRQDVRFKKEIGAYTRGIGRKVGCFAASDFALGSWGDNSGYGESSWLM